jgi:hypothetical protein
VVAPQRRPGSADAERPEILGIRAVARWPHPHGDPWPLPALPRRVDRGMGGTFGVGTEGCWPRYTRERPIVVTRRSYGSGSLFVRRDAGGQETWYGKWYSGGRRMKRKIGPKRQRGSREGLTRAQAERELQRRVESERAIVRSGLTVESAGRLYLEHLEHVLERKPSTLGDYRSILRAHAVPFFSERPLERIDADDLRRYIAAKKHDGLATKTITNQLIFLHGFFAFAVKRGWLAVNPVAAVDRPRARGGRVRVAPALHRLPGRKRLHPTPRGRQGADQVRSPDDRSGRPPRPCQGGRSAPDAGRAARSSERRGSVVTHGLQAGVARARAPSRCRLPGSVTGPDRLRTI